MSKITRTSTSPLLSLGLCAVLAACTSQNSETPLADAEKQAAPAAAPASNVTNPPLKPEEVKTEVIAAAEPIYQAADDSVTFKVKLVNNGKVTLPVTGNNPVIMGVVQMTPSSNQGEPDARGTDTRAAFAGDIQPGSASEVVSTLPAAFLLDKKVMFEPLQENVQWFGHDLKQPTLVLGPFARCADGKGICDATGKPLESK